MKIRDRHELMQVMLIRKMTGKSHKICLFCLRWAKGDFHRAVQLCSSRPESKEGDRRSQARMAA